MLGLRMGTVEAVADLAVGEVQHAIGGDIIHLMHGIEGGILVGAIAGAKLNRGRRIGGIDPVNGDHKVAAVFAHVIRIGGEFKGCEIAQNRDCIRAREVCNLNLEGKWNCWRSDHSESPGNSRVR